MSNPYAIDAVQLGFAQVSEYEGSKEVCVIMSRSIWTRSRDITVLLVPAKTQGRTRGRVSFRNGQRIYEIKRSYSNKDCETTSVAPALLTLILNE